MFLVPTENRFLVLAMLNNMISVIQKICHFNVGCHILTQKIKILVSTAYVSRHKIFNNKKILSLDLGPRGSDLSPPSSSLPTPPLCRARAVPLFLNRHGRTSRRIAATSPPTPRLHDACRRPLLRLEIGLHQVHLVTASADSAGMTKCKR
jgi:hypothetical protein